MILNSKLRRVESKCEKGRQGGRGAERQGGSTAGSANTQGQHTNSPTQPNIAQHNSTAAHAENECTMRGFEFPDEMRGAARLSDWLTQASLTHTLPPTHSNTLTHPTDEFSDIKGWMVLPGVSPVTIIHGRMTLQTITTTHTHTRTAVRTPPALKMN